MVDGQRPDPGTRSRSPDPPSDQARRVEIVHESLLREWPRLVRWQAQDGEGALLRDQLRQTARLWEERGQPEDMLWAGTSFKEYEIWRERYAGGLSATEERFTAAMARRESSRRRRRRLAFAAVLAIAVSVAGVTSYLWRQSELARRKAEAAEILSAGRLRLEGYPTAALAHAIASLERFDNAAARRFAVEALWRGPMASFVSDSIAAQAFLPEWSPDGRWLATGGMGGLFLHERDGGEPRSLVEGFFTSPEGFSPDSSRLLARVDTDTHTMHLWSLPDLREVKRWPVPGFAAIPKTTSASSVVWTGPEDRRLLSVEYISESSESLLIRERSVDSAEERILGPWPGPTPGPGGRRADFDPAGKWLVSLEDGRILRRRLSSLDEVPEVVGTHEGKAEVWLRPWVGRVVTADDAGEVRVWDPESGSLRRTLRTPGDARRVALDPSGRYIATAGGGGPMPPGSFHLLDLGAPAGADAIPLLNDDVNWLNRMRFHPSGRLLAAGHYPSGVLLWNLSGARSIVFRAQRGALIGVTFTPDGQLVSTSDEGVVRLFPLWTDPETDVQELHSRPVTELLGGSPILSPDGRFVIVTDRFKGKVLYIPISEGDGALREWTGPGAVAPIALSPDGRHLAISMIDRFEGASLHVLDLETWSSRELKPPDTAETCVVRAADDGLLQIPQWLPDGRLITDGAFGLHVWSLEDGSSRQLRACRDLFQTRLVTPDGRSVLGLSPGETKAVSVFDIDSGEERWITSHGKRVSAIAIDSTGTTLVTGDADGLVRVGPLSGGEPHLLYGHGPFVRSVAVSPDGKWVASAGDDETIRLWPMPDISESPLHLLPRDELLERLRRVTNLRVVEDPEAVSGFALRPGPFDGWADLAEW